MGCTRCFTGLLLHILNSVDLVLGGSVLLFGLLLPLHWGMWSLVWIWVPLISIGGLTVLMVFVSECGTMDWSTTGLDCGCLLSLSSLLGALVGAVELVAAVVLVTLNAWIQRQFLGALAKICGEAGVPKFCDGKQHYERDFKAWSKWAGFAMFGLCAGQLIRMVAGGLFRKAQATTEFEDPFRNDFDYYSVLPAKAQRAATGSTVAAQPRAPEKRWGR